MVGSREGAMNPTLKCLGLTESAAWLLAGAATLGVAVALAMDLADVPVNLAKAAVSIVLYMGLIPGVLVAATWVTADSEHEALIRGSGWALSCGAGLVVIELAAGDARLGGLLAAALGVAVTALIVKGIERLGRRSPSVVVQGSLLRLVCVWLAATAAVTALDQAAKAMATGLRAGWLAQAVVDGALLVAPALLTLVARTRPGPGRSLLGAPSPRWFETVVAFTTLAVVATLLQAWLWRYPGAQATGMIVVLWAAAVSAVVALLLPRHAMGASPGHGDLARGCLEMGAVVLGLSYVAVTMVSMGLQPRTLVFAEAPAGMWAWGYRMMLGVAALYAVGQAGALRGRDAATALGLLVAAVVSAGMGHWAWMTSQPEAGALLGVAGVSTTALGLLSLTKAGGSKNL